MQHQMRLTVSSNLAFLTGRAREKRLYLNEKSVLKC